MCHREVALVARQVDAGTRILTDALRKAFNVSGPKGQNETGPFAGTKWRPAGCWSDAGPEQGRPQRVVRPRLRRAMSGS